MAADDIENEEDEDEERMEASTTREAKDDGVSHVASASLAADVRTTCIVMCMRTSCRHSRSHPSAP